MWEDIIDYELGTYMMVATNDENGFKGYYAGLATEKNMLFLSEYTVMDDHGHELVTIDDQIVAIPREKIKYIELSYDEKSDVKKYWFKR